MRPTFTRVPNLKRYRRIVTVFARHGFGSLIEHIHLNQHVSFPARLLKPIASSRITPAEHLRLALEELGPTFIKLGQILSTRPDILGPDFILELSKLQDAVPPEPWEEIRDVLVEELGDEPEQFFDRIDPSPLAAASLAQVHTATLKTGNEVVLKIQRPNIVSTIETDLEILRDLASLAQRTPWGEINRPEEMVDEFSYSLHNELNYFREGRNADRFRSNFAGEKRLYIPKIYWEHTSSRVLVMERIEGIKIDNITALDKAGCDRKRVALNAANIIIKEVLQDGFFHADPHAGNLVVMNGEVIGAMDFGLVGEISDRDRKQLIRLYISAVSMDAENVVDEMIQMNAASVGVDRSRLTRDIDRLLNKYSGRALSDIHAQEIMDELMTLSSRYHVTIPANLWLLGKTLGMTEGLGLKLDPDFDFFAVSEPYVQQLKRQIWLPNKDWAYSILRQGSDWIEFINLMPRLGRSLLEKADQNRFEVRLKDTSRMMGGFNRLVNRISISILIAGLIIGIAILAPTLASDLAIKILIGVGLVIALSLSISLAISILKRT